MIAQKIFYDIPASEEAQKRDTQMGFMLLVGISFVREAPTRRSSDVIDRQERFFFFKTNSQLNMAELRSIFTWMLSMQVLAVSDKFW